MAQPTEHRKEGWKHLVLSDLGFRRFLLGPWESGVWGGPFGSLSGCQSLTFLDVSAVNFLTLWDRQEGSLGPGDDSSLETYLQVSVKGMSVTTLDMMAMCDTAFCPPVGGGRRGQAVGLRGSSSVPCARGMPTPVFLGAH